MTYTGAVKSAWKPTNYKWSEVGFGSTPFDWTTGFTVKHLPKVKDQQNSFSCGGQAMSYYGEVLNEVFDGKPETRSAKFIYALSYYPYGGGSTIDDLTKTVTIEGFGYEDLTPSNDNGIVTESFMRRREDITMEAFNKAFEDRALTYVWVSNTNIDTIAQAIRDNNGAIIGITGANNGTWLSKFPAVPYKGEWHHWVYAFGAEKIDGKKHIKILNSWGENCGENGVQYLGEEHFTQGFCFAVVTLVYNDKVVTKPTHKFERDLHYKTNTTDKSYIQEVKFLQDTLKYLGFMNKDVPSSGFYGDITKRAVYDFMVAYKVASWWTLYWNGGKFVGKLTRAKLNEVIGTA